MERRSSGGRFPIDDRTSALPYLSVLVCLLLVPLALFGDRHRAEAKTVRAGKAGITTVRLPDGSRATLVNGASISYRDDFVRRRRAWVTGQATFDVREGPAFSLWTQTAFITTTGAFFIVRAVGRETTFVAARRGTLRLRALNDETDPAFRSATIAAGQQAFAVRLVGAKVTSRVAFSR